MYIPFLGGAIFLLGVTRNFPLSWLRILNKGALLLMEVAEHAQYSSLVDHAARFSTSTRVTRSLPPGSGGGYAREGGSFAQ